MTDITTPAQMREAAARLAEADAREADDSIIDAWLKDLAAAIRALPVAEPEPLAVRVNPLKWVFHDQTGDYKSVYISGGWTISHRGDGCFALHHRDFNEGVDRAYQTPEAAQAAAEADHAARILSQIDAVSVAQVRAEVLREVLADDEMCLRLAEGYDREDAAQRGEPSPHTMGDEGYAEWAADRISCAKAGLRALIGG